MYKIVFGFLLFLVLVTNTMAIKCKIDKTDHIDIPYIIYNESYYVGIKHTENSSFLIVYDKDCNLVKKSIAEEVFEYYLVDKISSGINNLDFNLTTSEDFKKILEQMRTYILYTETGSNFLRPSVSFVDDISPYIQKATTVGSNIDVVIRWSELQKVSNELQDGRILTHSEVEEYKDTCGRFVASGLSAFLITQAKGIKKLGPIFIQSFYGLSSSKKAKNIASNTEKFMQEYPEAYEAVLITLEVTKIVASKTANKFCYPFIDAPTKLYAKEMELQLETGKGIKETTGETITEIGNDMKEAGKGFLNWIINLLKKLFELN